MKKRSLFQAIFKGKEKPQKSKPAETSTGRSSFYPWSGNPYDSDVARAAISSHATHIAKLVPRHIRREGDQVIDFPDPNLRRLLKRPNPRMGMFDLLMKTAAQREEYGNAFLFAQWEGERLKGLYPIVANAINLLETEDGELYVQFSMRSGKVVVLPYNEVIHLRKHFSHDDIFGDSNMRPLEAPLQVLHTVDQGIVKAVKRGANLRGVLEFTQTIRPEDAKKLGDEFVANFLMMDNDGGVAVADPRYKFRDLKPEGYVPNKPQIDFSKERVYSYYGTNEAIIQSKYTEDQWNAYYESVVEPAGIQLSEEFTEKLFTPTERAHGKITAYMAEGFPLSHRATNDSRVCWLVLM